MLNPENLKTALIRGVIEHKRALAREVQETMTRIDHCSGNSIVGIAKQINERIASIEACSETLRRIRCEEWVIAPAASDHQTQEIATEAHSYDFYLRRAFQKLEALVPQDELVKDLALFFSNRPNPLP